MCTSARTGAITLSMSQMPWWMDWKCQLLAGLHVDRDDRAGEQVLAAALRAVLRGVAAARVAERPVDQPELRVDRRVHPRRGAAGLPRGALPGVVAGLA